MYWLLLVIYHLEFLGPYTSIHLSSNALIIKPDTCPKKVADAAACNGFANSYVKSYETSAGPLELFGSRCVVWEFEAALRNLQVVDKVLNSGVDDDATACQTPNGQDGMDVVVKRMNAPAPT